MYNYKKTYNNLLDKLVGAGEPITYDQKLSENVEQTSIITNILKNNLDIRFHSKLNKIFNLRLKFIKLTKEEYNRRLSILAIWPKYVLEYKYTANLTIQDILMKISKSSFDLIIAAVRFLIQLNIKFNKSQTGGSFLTEPYIILGGILITIVILYQHIDTPSENSNINQLRFAIYEVIEQLTKEIEEGSETETDLLTDSDEDL